MQRLLAIFNNMEGTEERQFGNRPLIRLLFHPYIPSSSERKRERERERDSLMA
jgi:hypothetical protein